MYGASQRPTCRVYTRKVVRTTETFFRLYDSHGSQFLFFGNLTKHPSAHDVVAAYCLAMAEVRVRLPLGALNLRVWESRVFRVLREHEIAGSNPDILTWILRWVPCWYGRAAVNRFVAGSIPASAA